MKLVALTAFVALTACTPGQLEEVADKIPVTIKCPDMDREAAVDLINAFKNDPVKVEADLRNEVKQGPAQALAVTCRILDAQKVLLETGQRFSEAYEKATQALRDLKVIK